MDVLIGSEVTNLLFPQRKPKLIRPSRLRYSIFASNRMKAMNRTTIISTWIEPQWTEGWPILYVTRELPHPSVWLIDPEHAHTVLSHQYSHLLSEGEQARASRFVQPAHQIRYKTAHTVLRMLLATDLQTDPASLRIVGGHHNKPELHAGNDTPLVFNISHTESKSIIGIAQGYPIGVDIEWWHRPMVIDDMLTACFSPSEIDYITARPDAMRTRFFTLWTRKEAILKLTGEGIGEHLPLFEVMDGNSVAEKHIIGGNPPDRIYLYSFLLDDGYLGCYAAPEPLDSLTVYKL